MFSEGVFASCGVIQAKWMAISHLLGRSSGRNEMANSNLRRTDTSLMYLLRIPSILKLISLKRTDMYT